MLHNRCVKAFLLAVALADVPNIRKNDLFLVVYAILSLTLCQLLLVRAHNWCSMVCDHSAGIGGSSWHPCGLYMRSWCKYVKYVLIWPKWCECHYIGPSTVPKLTNLYITLVDEHTRSLASAVGGRLYIHCLWWPWQVVKNSLIVTYFAYCKHLKCVEWGLKMTL